MDVKEAVAQAKKYLADVFVDEQISNLGLEEVEFDEEDDTWLITLGFSRPWSAGRVGALSASLGLDSARSYKVVCIADEDGNLISIKNREPVAA